MAIVKSVRAKLYELYSRVISVDEKDDSIYTNGDNNLYPYELDRAINNSPTAKRAKTIMANFISGRGVTDDRLVNPKRGLYLSDLVNDIADEIAGQYGSFIWIGYGFSEDGDLVKKNPEVLDYANCRESREDDNEYPGRIYLKDWASKKSMFGNRKKEDKKWYYPFNDNPEIVRAQMRSDAAERLGKKKEDVTIEEMVTNYRGQVFHLNLTERYKYALSQFDSVFNDMDSEYRFSLYVNTQMRTGFLGKTIFITQGLDEQAEENTGKDLAKFLGAENSGSLYYLNVEEAEKLDNVLKVEQLKPQLDDKLFVENDKRIRRNILGAANNLPEPLIYAGEGALFGTSADAYTEMKLFYQEQTLNERSALEKTLEKIGFPAKIILIVEEDKEKISSGGEKSEGQLKAQAALKGSVGGVQGILGIQASYAQGKTDFESAITILVEIYGFTREISVDLLGRPDEDPKPNLEEDGKNNEE